MKLKFLFAMALLLGLTESAASYDRVVEHRNWTRAGPYQGFNEYYLHGSNNSRIAFICGPADSDAEDPAYEGDVSFTINGADTPANMVVTLSVDGREFLFRSPGKASETSLPCPDCSNLAEFWRAVRISKTVGMRLADGRHARFASAGGAKILGKELCTG